MTWNKSGLKRKLNGRWLRWRASRALVSAAPMLKPRLNFFAEGRAVEALALAELFTDETVLEDPFSSAEIDFIRARAAKNDAPGVSDYWRAPIVFKDEFFLLNDVWMMGHTGRLVDKDQRAVVTDWGEPENWNRDKIAMLSAGDAIDGVALPIANYNNYFHFFLEAALPLVAYFESGAAPYARHVILSAPNKHAFAYQTLSAIAQRYNADLRILGKREKALCASAVAFRRQSPCADWYPAKPETAAALTTALRASLGAEAKERSDQLYLRRKPEKIRNLENGDALDARLRAMGFDSFTPAAANFPDQVENAYAARRLLAVHGAALANMLFARPGADIFEIFGAQHCKSVFMMLAKQLGHRHRAIIGGESDQRQNFAVDLNAVETALNQSN